MTLLYIGIGAVFGFVLAWFISRGAAQRARDAVKAEAATALAVAVERLDSANARLRQEQDKSTELEDELRVEREIAANLRIEKTAVETRAEANRQAADEKLALLGKATDELSNAFKALSAEALNTNNKSFLDLAKPYIENVTKSATQDLESRQKAIDELVKPLKETLEKVDANVRQLESKREAAYSGITEQINSLSASQSQLRGETGNLVKALRTPQGRGRWGEVQLRRVVEFAGMVDYCDFREQASVETDNGRLRPDLIVKLPGGRTVVVDAKTPLSAYLDSLETTDEERKAELLRQHARQVKTHIDQLSGKSYFEQFSPSPELVVMFLEAESIFSGALQGDPSLIEYGAQKRVVVATPTTLIALLRAVAYGWRQEQIAENAQRISDLGRELYQRLTTFGGHMYKVGSNLESAVGAYNDAVGSLERNVLSGARKFNSLGIQTKDEIKELKSVDTATRHLTSDELRLELPGGDHGTEER